MSIKIAYNEIDPFCCAWLSNLMDAGHIRPGTIIQKSICDLAVDEVAPYELLHFFAGIGGWDYALTLADWQSDGRVTWTGSCPCQPLSGAGRRQGHADERHLWPAFHRLIAECRPPVVCGEQVASRLGREWLAGVRADLEAVGYAVGAADLCAAGVGAPHIRQRLFWVADAQGGNRQVSVRGRRPQQESAQPRGCGGTGGLANADDAGPQGRGRGELQERPGQSTPWARGTPLPCRDGKARRAEPGVFPLAHGVSGRVGRLRAYGNAIVPQAAAAFIRAYLDIQC